MQHFNFSDLEQKLPEYFTRFKLLQYLNGKPGAKLKDPDLTVGADRNKLVLSSKGSAEDAWNYLKPLSDLLNLQDMLVSANLRPVKPEPLKSIMAAGADYLVLVPLGWLNEDDRSFVDDGTEIEFYRFFRAYQVFKQACLRQWPLQTIIHGKFRQFITSLNPELYNVSADEIERFVPQTTNPGRWQLELHHVSCNVPFGNLSLLRRMQDLQTLSRQIIETVRRACQPYIGKKKLSGPSLQHACSCSLLIALKIIAIYFNPDEQMVKRLLEDRFIHLT